MNRTNFRYLCLLLALAVLLLFLTKQSGSLYGSDCDWFSQHVSIADTMRQTIRAEGTLLVGQLPLGGGSNVYDFSYYGYFRPDVLLGCLLPDVPMADLITAYSIAGYLTSVLLFYIFLRKNGRGPRMALFGGILFLCAGCFFQIHRQIMFVNYMPFLLGALLCIPDRGKWGKRLLLVLMMFLVELHSYYYAISGLFVLYLFFLYRTEWGENRCLGKRKRGGNARKREWAGILAKWERQTLCFAGFALTSVAMAGVLLLPTAASILSCAAGKDGGNAGKNPWEFGWDFDALLYGGYGLGLTLLVLFLLVLSLCRKRARLLAAFLIFSLVCGLVPFVLNGFLYNRPKILIPFLPLVLFLSIETLEEYWTLSKKPSFFCLLPAGAAAWWQYREQGEIWIWADAGFVLLIFGVLWWNGRAGSQRADLPERADIAPGQTAEEVRQMLCEGKRTFGGYVLAGLLAAMCSMIFIFAVVLHRGDEFIRREQAAPSRFSREERQEFYKRQEYRFDSLLSSYQTANCLLGDGAGRTSMYTSTGNGVYSRFFYDEIANPIGNNNRVGLYNRANPFFLYLMGVRYLETTEQMLPDGYHVLAEKNGAVLAEREDVLPLCYGTGELMSEEAYRKLEFPENLEALVNFGIVPAEAETDLGGQQEFVSHFQKINPVEGKDYVIQESSGQEFTVIPKEPLENQILAVRFRVKRNTRAAVTISINGIVNKLSGASAPYPNQNTVFTYLLSGTEPITEFKVKTQGDFTCSDLEVYRLDASFVGNREVCTLDGGEVSGREKANGMITMPKDGYLITSFPIQRGYRVWVDGKECPVETVNQAFLGVPLSAGTHEIRILYEPPLEKAGLALSAGGWLLWSALGIWAVGASRRKERLPMMGKKEDGICLES